LDRLAKLPYQLLPWRGHHDAETLAGTKTGKLSDKYRLARTHKRRHNGSQRTPRSTVFGLDLPPKRRAHSI
jgi:hypothetical protein